MSLIVVSSKFIDGITNAGLIFVDDDGFFELGVSGVDVNTSSANHKTKIETKSIQN